MMIPVRRFVLPILARHVLLRALVQRVLTGVAKQQAAVTTNKLTELGRVTKIINDAVRVDDDTGAEVREKKTTRDSPALSIGTVVDVIESAVGRLILAHRRLHFARINQLPANSGKIRTR